MSTYARIKQTVTTRQAAERYGLSVNRSGMTRCPFHEDHNPSMKVDDRFYCFGCHASGDVIDFTARLFGLSPYAAAQKLETDFGIGAEHEHCHSPPMQSHPTIGSGSVFVFSGIICGTFVFGSCGISRRSRATPSIPALPRR